MKELDFNSILEYERCIWKAAKNRDSAAFLEVVSEDAVMVCGGGKFTGSQYAHFIGMFDCKSYAIDDFEIVNRDASSIQVHYIVSCEVNDEKNSDLAGRFHVTTTWISVNDKWKAVFNMDQRVDNS